MASTQLRKTLSTFQLSLYGIGTMLGAGIYVLVGEVAGYAGMFAPLSFVVAAVLAAFTALSYAELSAWFPQSAGEVVFVEQGFRRKWLSVGIGWLVMINGIISAGAIVKGFTGYLAIFTDFPAWAALILLTLFLGAMAIWGIGESLNLIGAITLVEVSGLIFVIVMAGDSLGTLPERSAELFPTITGDNLNMLFSGAFLAFYAFVGFEDLANVAEEARNPRKSMPRAVIISMVVASLLYVLVSLVSVLSLPPAELAETSAPLARVLAVKGESLPLVISGISLIAVVNGALAQIVMGSRVLYGMADRKLAPSFFARLHPRFQTPVAATVLVTLVILILSLTFPIKDLAEFSSFVIIFVFGCVNGALLALKLRKVKAPSDSLHFGMWVPLLGVILSLAFLAYRLGVIFLM